MATKVGEAYYDITARVDKLEAELKKASAAVDQHSKKTQGLLSSAQAGYLAVAAAVAIVAKVILDAVDAAATFTKEAAKFKNVFGPEFDRASKSVENLTKNYAMSDDEAMKYLSTTQNLLTSMGLSGKAATGYSDEMVRLASDMGMFNNVPTAEALQAISGALAGGTRALRQYGVVLNDNMVQREAQRLGLSDLYTTLSEANRAQATYSLILKQTANQQGQTARSTETYGFIVKQLKVNLEEANQAFGLKMLPGVTSLANVFKIMTEQGSAFRGMLEGFGTTAGKSLAGLAVTVALLNVALERAATGWDRLFNEGGKGTALWELNQKNIEKANKLLDDAANKYETLSFFQNKQSEASKKSTTTTNQLGTALKTKTKIQNETTTTIEQMLEAQKEWDRYTVGPSIGAVEKLTGAFYKLQDQLNKKIITQETFDKSFKKVMIDFSISMAGDLMSAAGILINNLFEAQIQQIQKQAENMSKILDFAKQAELDAAGFHEDTEAEKNRKDIQRLRERLRTEKDETKKAAIQKQLDEKLHLQKKFDIEQNYENLKLVMQELMDRKRLVLQRKAAMAQRITAEASVIINAASAIMSGWAAAMSMQSSGGNVYAGIALGAVVTALVAALAAVESAAIWSAPMPTAAQGMVTNRPAIFGEAGLEMAFPLEGQAGRIALKGLAGGLVEAIQDRTPSPDAAGFISGVGGQMNHVVVYFNDEKLYDRISKATRDGKLIIHARAVA